MTRDLRSVPRSSLESLPFMQSRLATFGLTGAASSLLFLLIDATVNATTGLHGMPLLMLIHLLTAAIAFGLYLVARGAPRSERTLLGLDLSITWVECALFILALHRMPLWTRPELVELLCVTDILVLRAFLVPSSASRTTLVGLVAVSAVLVSTTVLYSGARVHPEAPGALAYVLVAGVLGLGTLLLTTLTSRTIFGLRERVKQAMQLGQYTIVRKIGEGAMGVVYEATHAMLRRRTAIKLMRPDRNGASNLARFEREVQLTATLSHPNTVAVYDYGRSAQGDLYYAMELLDGVNLQALVDADGPQPPGRAVHILGQVCGALAEAHAVGLIHRDVKPANIILCDRGGAPDVAKVLDFGLVKSITGDDARASHSDAIIGTPLYLAPEVIRAPESVTPAIDLYALGGVAYFLLTGRPPFTGKSMVEVCGRHLHTIPTPVSKATSDPISESLSALVASCLAKSPEERPESAEALARSLRECPEAGSWTADLARTWWRQQGPRVLAHRDELTSPPSPDADTVAVLLQDRFLAAR